MHLTPFVLPFFSPAAAVSAQQPAVLHAAADPQQRHQQDSAPASRFICNHHVCFNTTDWERRQQHSKPCLAWKNADLTGYKQPSPVRGLHQQL